MRLPFFHHQPREEARRALLVEVLEVQIGESVRRRREGTTDVRSLMDQLQAGDQGDSRLQNLRGAWAEQNRLAGETLASWAAMTPETWTDAYPWMPREARS